MRIILGLTALILLFLVVFNGGRPCCIETTRQIEFIVEEPFQKVAQTLVRKDMMAHVVESNNGSIIDKKWVNRNFDLSRPFNAKLRTWEFNGTLEAKLKIRDDYAGERIVDLKQNVQANQEIIWINSTLATPTQVGLTGMEQWIEIFPEEQRTKIRFTVSMSLKRLIPTCYHRYAETQVNKAADRQIANFEPVFRKGLEDKGFRITLPFRQKTTLQLKNL